MFEPHLLTEQGLEQLRQLAPTAKADKIKQAFAEMKEMQALFVEQPHFTILATKRNRRSLQAFGDGGGPQYRGVPTLEACFFASRELQNFFANLEKCQLGELAPGLRKLHDFPQLQGNLQAFNDAGFIENFASEELARIRRKKNP